jgi:hypothetical protein
MQVTVNITIVEEDEFTLSLSEAADAVLKALGGDEAKDLCRVSVMGSAAIGPEPVPTMMGTPLPR